MKIGRTKDDLDKKHLCLSNSNAKDSICNYPGLQAVFAV